MQNRRGSLVWDWKRIGMQPTTRKGIEKLGVHDIGAVVLVYVNCTKTIKCVQSPLNQKNVSCRIVIMGNSSKSDSVERLRQAFASMETVRLLNTRKNLGFAKGNNLEIQNLWEKGI